MAYKPKRGDALLFYDVTPSYKEEDTFSMHTGCECWPLKALTCGLCTSTHALWICLCTVLGYLHSFLVFPSRVAHYCLVRPLKLCVAACLSVPYALPSLSNLMQHDLQSVVYVHAPDPMHRPRGDGRQVERSQVDPWQALQAEGVRGEPDQAL